MWLALALSSLASSAPIETSMGKIGVDPAGVNKQEVKIEASIAMGVARKAGSYCKGKAKAIFLMPPVAGEGTEAKMSGGMSTVAFQACVDVPTAMEMADRPMNKPVVVTGTVRLKKAAGILMAVVLDNATIQEPAATSED